MLRRLDIDVVHVADENLDVLLGVSATRPIRRLLSTIALVAIIRVGRMALVRTVQNRPGSPTDRPITRLADQLLDRATTRYIVFDRADAFSDRTTVIPHAHYRDRFIGYPRGAQVPGRVLCLSASEVYSERVALLELVRGAKTEGVSGRLAGVIPAALKATIEQDSSHHSAMISFSLGPLSDGARVQEIDRSEVVLVPEVDTLEQLQTVFLALSLDRAVLVPRTEAMSNLAQATGAGWVHLFEASLTSADLDKALDAARNSDRAQQPYLEGRELASTHDAYAAAFRAAAGLLRNRTAGPHRTEPARESPDERPR